MPAEAARRFASGQHLYFRRLDMPKEADGTYLAATGFDGPTLSRSHALYLPGLVCRGRCRARAIAGGA